jgi:hypothetical protein
MPDNRQLTTGNGHSPNAAFAVLVSLQNTAGLPSKGFFWKERRRKNEHGRLRTTERTEGAFVIPPSLKLSCLADH